MSPVVLLYTGVEIAQVNYLQYLSEIWIIAACSMQYIYCRLMCLSGIFSA